MGIPMNTHVAPMYLMGTNIKKAPLEQN